MLTASRSQTDAFGVRGFTVVVCKILNDEPRERYEDAGRVVEAREKEGPGDASRVVNEAECRRDSSHVRFNETSFNRMRLVDSAHPSFLTSLPLAVNIDSFKSAPGKTSIAVHQWNAKQFWVDRQFFKQEDNIYCL
jgi:hypothetical protein